MKNGRVLIVILLAVVVVIAIVLVAMFGRPNQPKALACPSRVTTQADVNFVNRSMSDLKGLKLELLENASMNFKLNNQATVTGTIRLILGPAVAEPTVTFNAQFAISGGQLNAVASDIQVVSGPAAIPIPKGTLPDSLSRDLTKAFAQVVTQVAPKDPSAQLAAVRTDAAQMVLDFVIPCPNTPAPSATR